MQTNRCLTCKFLRMDKIPMGCAAFPNGIPNVIYTGEFDHIEPYEGDRGIQWAPVEG